MANRPTANGAKIKISTGIHCIDLSGPDIHKSASLLKQACLESGIFYIINHGISEELKNEVFAQSKKFFQLPWDEKMKHFWNEKQRGYHPSVRFIIDPETNQKDHRETYHLGVEIPDDDPDAGKVYYAPNYWLPADTFPGWKEPMHRFHQEALDVGRAVARILALALGLSSDFFDQPKMLGKAVANLDLLHYGAHVTDPTKELLGTPAHTDFSLITILASDDRLGLQICKDKNASPQIWEYVPPLKGALIVNCGQTLERLSNGVFKATMHRVLFRHDRYSVALFIFPNHEADIECLSTCTSEENPPKYPSLKTEEFLSANFKKAADLRLQHIAGA